MDAKLHHEIENFLGKLAYRCIEHGVSLNLYNDASIDSGGVPCAGWFSADTKELAVATGVETMEWYMTALHEYAHMLQWIDDPALFSELETGEDNVFRWLRHEVEYTQEELDRHVKSAIVLEGDAEMRVIKMINEGGLSIDVEAYGRKGSSYAHFYRAAARKRRWYSSGFAPYRLAEVWSIFPDNVDPNWQPEERHYQAYEACFQPEND